MKSRGLRIFCFLIAALVWVVPASAVEIHMYAAASLTDVLQEISDNYEKASGDKIVLSLGASNALARQIQEGAPADLFFSADEAKMNALEKAGLLLKGTRKSLLSNTLVIVVPSDSNLKIGSAQDLATSKIRALALSEPQTVPVGIYAKEYLRSKKLWSKVIDKVIPTENVRATLVTVELGNVDAGIVYKTDAQISKKVKIALEIPAAEGPKISYPLAVMAESKNQAAARKFLAYLESAAAMDVFRRYGFLTASP